MAAELYYSSLAPLIGDTVQRQKTPGTRLRARRLALALMLLLPLGLSAQQFPFAGEVVALLGAADRGVTVSIADRPIYSAGVQREMYQLNEYQPLWDEAGVRALSSALAGLEADGLSSSALRFPEIAGQLQRPALSGLAPREAAQLDVLFSEAFLRAAYQLYFGKVDPKRVDADINFVRADPDETAVPRLLQAIRSGAVAEALDRARPDNQAYERLKVGLRQYRSYQAAGGWGPIAAGPTLRPGDMDVRVEALRERLAMTGDYIPDVSAGAGAGRDDGVVAAERATRPEGLRDPRRYDESLEAAVRRFQRRHALDADAALGPATLAAMNVPVEARIDQIRVNLERMRWVLHEVRDEYLVVNIAGFEVFWVADSQVVWREDVQVGTEFTQTPVFAGTMTYLEFNPTWTIPPGILRRSVLPGLRSDPGYLQKRGYLLLTPGGEPVDPSTVDFRALDGFPYIVRQPAGPDNALGQVKFMFPNPHFVFLHDTNHRELFDRSRRTFSAGCIRLRNPFVLAEKLLSRQGWTRERIDEVLASGETTRVALEQPMRIFVTYFTALMPPGESRVRFWDDVYARDDAILEGLEGPFVPRLPGGG